MKSAFGAADNPLINCGLCSSIGLHRISFVRASEEPFKTYVSDVSESKKDFCPPGDPTRQCPTLPPPTSPRRPAVRSLAPTRPWYVRVLDSTIDLDSTNSRTCLA